MSRHGRALHRAIRKHRHRVTVEGYAAMSRYMLRDLRAHIEQDLAEGRTPQVRVSIDWSLGAAVIPPPAGLYDIHII